MAPVSYPAVPPQASYTSCYCEENVYLLAASFLEMPDFRGSWDLSAVFISNWTKTVALWSQRAARAEGIPAVWDYHVVLVLRPLFSSSQDDTDDGEDGHTGSLIYDFDTTLDLPYDARDYLKQTFPYIEDPSSLDARYQRARIYSLFRIVPGDVFVTDFASDRSHMIADEMMKQLVLTPEETPSSADDGVAQVQSPPTSFVYQVAPPIYPPIAGVRARENGVTHNLMSDFVDMANLEGSGVVMNLGEFMSWIIS